MNSLLVLLSGCSWSSGRPRENLSLNYTAFYSSPVLSAGLAFLSFIPCLECVWGMWHLHTEAALWVSPPLVMIPLTCLTMTIILACVQWPLHLHKEMLKRASLVAQRLRICLLMQGTRVRALVWEDPTCRGAAGPVSHNYWACASGACAPQQERSRWWEARAPWWGVAPTCRN